MIIEGNVRSVRSSAQEDLRLVHATPGRRRWIVPKLRESVTLSEKLRRTITDIAGVDRCTVNPKTGSVLVLFQISNGESEKRIRSTIETFVYGTKRRAASPTLKFQTSSVIQFSYGTGISLRSSAGERQRWVMQPAIGNKELATWIQTQSLLVPGIRSCTVNPSTGSVLIYRDPVQGDDRAMAEFLQHAERRWKQERPVRSIVRSTANVTDGSHELQGLPSFGLYFAAATAALIVPQLGILPLGPLGMGLGFIAAAAITVTGVVRYLRAHIMQRTGGRSLKRLLQYLKPYRRELLLAIGFSVLRKIVDFAPPIFIGIAVNVVSGNPPAIFALFGIASPHLQLIALAATAWLTYLIESSSEYQFKWRWRALAQAVQRDLRSAAYSHCQAMELRAIEHHSTGEITAILNDNINQLQLFLDDGPNAIIEISTNFLVIVAAFSFLAPQIAGLTLLPIPFVAWLAIRYQERTGPLYMKIQRVAGFISRRIVNNLSGLTTIRSYGTEAVEAEKIKALSDDYARESIEAAKLYAAFEPTVRIPIQTTFASLLIAGGFSVLGGSISAGSFSTVLFLLPRFLFPFAYMGQTLDRYQRAMAATDRIFSLLEDPVETNSGHIRLENVHGDIVFENVAFHYRPDVPVLKDFNLTIRAGQTIGIAGVTGSGKTTLVKLLLRFYEVNGGHIRLDGYDIRDLEMTGLRNAIGVVSQEVFLFDGTIRENISYGSQSADESQMRHAAELAEISDYIEELPGGYDFQVGERGMRLSGGQRQRIGLARALVKNPPILILDEATSALDNETEAAIQRSMAQVTVGRTTIIIAHRLSTIRNANRILVLGAQGDLMESGTHDELISQGGLYASLWNVQTGATISDDGRHNRERGPKTMPAQES